MSLIIGHVALIQESKKQWFTLKAIRALRDKGYDAVGVFAGECREPEYMTELSKIVEEYGLSGSVTFLGRRNDIPDLLKMIDVLIIPSAFEGFPLAGLEAAAAGVPVAACNVAGAEEFIQVSGDGACFKQDDVEEAISAIEKALQSREEMIPSGKEFAESSSEDSYKKKIGIYFKDVVA